MTARRYPVPLTADEITVLVGWARQESPPRDWSILRYADAVDGAARALEAAQAVSNAAVSVAGDADSSSADRLVYAERSE